jgi:antitoxin MazE
MVTNSRSVTVERWDDSLAVRIPASVVRALNLEQGDVIDVRVELAGSLEAKMDDDRLVALADLRRLRRPLPPDFRFRRHDFAE